MRSQSTTISLQDVMNSGGVRVSPQMSLIKVLTQMQQAKEQISTSCVLVMENEQLVGLLTEQDFVRFAFEGLSLAEVKVAEVMTRQLVTLQENHFRDIFTVLTLFCQHDLRYLPVVSETGNLLGMITQSSLLQALNSTDLYPTVERLQEQVKQLQAKKGELLHTQNQTLEQEVLRRTANLENQAKREQLLSNLAFQIHSSLDLEEILSTTIAEVRQLLNCDRVLIYRLQAEGGGIIEVESVNPEWESLKGVIIHDPCFQRDHIQAYTQGRIHAIEDVYTAGISPCHLELLEGLQVRANLVLPILNNQQLWGLLAAQHCRAPKSWHPSDIEFLQKLITQVGIAIQQANLLKSLERKLQEQQQTELALQQLNEQLETRIAQRTEELRTLNKELREEVVRRSQSEKKLKQQLNAVEAAIDGIAILDTSGQYTYLNQAHVKMFGYKSEGELLGQPWELCYKPEQAQHFQENVFPQLQQTRHWRGITTAQKKDGTTFAEEVSLTLTKDDHLICVCRDITERLEVEQALRQSQHFVQRIANTAPNILYIFDVLENRIVYVNNFTIDALGYSPEEVQEMGTSFFRELLHPDDLEKMRCYSQQLPTLENSEIREVDYRLKSASGKWSWFSSRDTVFSRSADGAVQQVLGIATDISQQRQAQEDLYKAFQEEKRLNSLKTHLVTMTSHEFRTPLTTILGTAELLQHYGDKWNSEKKSLYYQRIESCVQQIIQLLDNLLLLENSGTSEVTSHKQKTDIVRFCQIFIKAYQEKSTLKVNLELLTELASFWVELDTEILKILLKNLISNAVKYSEPGAIVKIILDQKEDSLILQIKDSGIGIPKEEINNIFEYFYRAKNAESYTGKGLGLAIVKNAVNLKGGDIFIESEMNVGTTVTVQIPFSTAEP